LVARVDRGVPQPNRERCHWILMPQPLQLPGDLRAMLDAVRRVGRPRLVGGGVRDWLLGTIPKDFDVEVGGVDFETLHRALAPFGSTDVVGRSFGVIKVRSK